MKKLYFLALILFSTTFVLSQSKLIITGVYDATLSGGLPKGIEIYVIENIDDLSIYGIGVSNNGGGSDGVEYSFPKESANKGDYIYLSSEIKQFTAFYDFPPNYITSIIKVNGDDAIELYMNNTVVDVYGEIDKDGTGLVWDYRDSWVYRKDETFADGNSFDKNNWIFGGPDIFDGAITNASSKKPMPIGTFKYSSNLSNKLFEFASVELFPIPSSNKLIFKSNTNKFGSFNIYNYHGQLIMSTKGNLTKTVLDISKLESGIYLLDVNTENNHQSFKFYK